MSARWLVDPAAVVLGTVPPEQRELARNLIAADPEFRTAVERLRVLTQNLSELPAGAWDGATDEVPALDLDAALASRPGVPPVPEPAPVPLPTRTRRLTLRPLVAVAASLALLAAGVGIGVLACGGDDGATTQAARPADTDPWVLASLRPLPGNAGSAATGRVALTLHPGGHARMRMRGLEPNKAGTFYEAWLMTDTRDLVSLGTFRVGSDGTARVDFGFGADPRSYRYVDVSLQETGAAPGHSGDSVLRTDQLG